MRLVAGFAMLLAASCPTGSTTGSPEPLKHRIIAQGAYGRYQGTAARTAYASTEAEYLSSWAALVTAGDPPPVDFTREHAVFLLAGQRPTGGYAIAVKAIRREPDTLVLDATVTPPPADAIVTQALTSPFVVLAIPKTDAAGVRWENE